MQEILENCVQASFLSPILLSLTGKVLMYRLGNWAYQMAEDEDNFVYYCVTVAND